MEAQNILSTSHLQTAKPLKGDAVNTLDYTTKPTIDPRDYGFTGQLEKMIGCANEDPDAAAMLTLGPSRTHAEGAIVVLKGDHAVALFREWAQEVGLVTPRRKSGMNKAFEECRRG